MDFRQPPPLLDHIDGYLGAFGLVPRLVRIGKESMERKLWCCSRQ